MLGLTLTAGILKDDRRLAAIAVRDWLGRAATWFEALGDAVLDAHLDKDLEGRPHLRIRCHPAAEPIDVRLTSHGRLKLVARTSPVGPGYHIYLCGLLRQFAEDFEFEWERPPGDHDPACFFVVGDTARLEGLFRHWLANRCQQVLSKLREPVSVGLPRGLKYLHPGPVQTPLGPRSVEWLKAVAADESAGVDFFAWLEPELNAVFYKNRALARLWLDFPFRPPLTEDEGEMTDQIAADLANALDEDAEIDLPWRAWQETIQAIEADAGQHTVEPISPELKALVSERSAGDTSTIGYRRYPVRVPLTGDWQIDVPGTFAARWSDDGLTWSAWDGPRTVWFRGLRVPGQKAAAALAVGRANLPAGERITARLTPPVLGDAVFGPHTEDGRSLYRLSGIAADDEHLAACNVYLHDLADKPWAIEVWRSLRRE